MTTCTSGEFVGDYFSDCYPYCVEKITPVVHSAKVPATSVDRRASNSRSRVGQIILPSNMTQTFLGYDKEWNMEECKNGPVLQSMV